MDRYPALYWCSLILAIIVSICSLTYWVYKFTQWWKRRHRRRTRWERTRQQQQERLALALEEHQELEALTADVAAELAATSALWRPVHRRHLAGRLKQLHARQADLEQEAAQLESQLAELDLIAAALRPIFSVATIAVGATAQRGMGILPQSYPHLLTDSTRETRGFLREHLAA